MQGCNWYSEYKLIYGIGTDICAIERIGRPYKKRGQIYASTFCNTQELNRVEKSKDPVLYLGKIHCAKECIGKAVGTGLIPEFWWDDIEINIVNNENEVFLFENGMQHIRKTLKIEGPWKLLLSLSSTNKFIAGVCVITAS